MRTIFTIICCLFLISAFGQKKTRDFRAGGYVNFYSQKNSYPLGLVPIIRSGYASNANDETLRTGVEFNPYVGKRLNKKWLLAFGLMLEHELYRVKDQAGTDIVTITLEDGSELTIQDPGSTVEVTLRTISNSIAGRVFARYYVPIVDRVELFLQPEVVYGVANVSYKQDESLIGKENAQFVQALVSPGAIFNVNDRLQMYTRVGSIGYLGGKWEIENTGRDGNFSNFSANFTISAIFFGLEIKL